MSQTVRLPANVIASGALSQLGVCARHGAPSSGTRERKFVSATPVWLLPIAILALLVAAIVAMAIQKTVKGPVPECASCRKERAAFVRNVWLGWVGSTALFFLAAATTNGTLFALWFLTLIVALVYSFAGNGNAVRGTTSRDGFWVDLRNVDPFFAEACARRMSGAPVQPQVHTPAPVGPGPALSGYYPPA